VPNKSKITSTENLVYRSKQIFGDKFSYLNTIFKSYKDKVVIGCQEHGEFLVDYHTHLNSKNWWM
jgi:hypothetical protein